MRYSIDGKYPMTANWLIFTQLDDGRYHIRNMLYDTEVIIEKPYFHFLKKLNGDRNPYKIVREWSEEKVDQVIHWLYEADLLRVDGRTIHSGIGSVYYTVWIPRMKTFYRVIAYFLNLLLVVGWLPVFVGGIILFERNMEHMSEGYLFGGFLLGLIVGIILHELAHAAACLAYGGRVFEFGLMFQNFMPGAYVLLDDEKIKKRFQRIQVYAAGVEMNFLLVGVCLILASSMGMMRGVFLSAAVNNLLLAVLNLTFIDGLDGSSVLAGLLGVEGLVDTAKAVLMNPARLRRLKREGINGRALIAISVILVCFQILLPIVIVTNILALIGGFI